MRFFPAGEEERLATLRGRLRAWKRSRLISGQQERILRERTRTRWTASSLIPRIVLFALTLVCVAAAYGLLDLAGLPAKFVTAIVCIGTAELLMIRFGLFRAGPDEALYPAALLLLVTALPFQDRNEGMLLIGASFLLSGLRLRNGLYLTASIAAAVGYVSLSTDSREIAAFLGLAVAFAALALLNREWRHPVWPRLFSWTVVLLPIMAWLLMTIEQRASRPWVMGATAIVALLMLFGGLAIRRHPPLIAGLLLSALTIAEWGSRLTFPVHYRLLALGVAVGAIALLSQRILGARTEGVTAKPLAAGDGLQLAEPALAAAVAGTQLRPAGEPRAEGGGGRYGGGGASGEF